MPPIEWQASTVSGIRVETPQTKSFTLVLPRWMAHQPGQHYDIRLTDPDGYQTERSYSVASEPERTGVIELTVERIADGEVSPYLHDIVMPGDRLEVRGPVGGYFIWNVEIGGPLLLLGGGSGVVPLMAMLRHRAAHKSPISARLLYSARTVDDVIYRSELEQLAQGDRALEVVFTFTRQAPLGWTGYSRRIDGAMLREVMGPLGSKVHAYICGPTLLVEAVASTLVQMDLSPQQIRTERFGPTGK